MGFFRFVNPLNRKVTCSRAVGQKLQYTILVYKGKGDVLMEAKHRGVRLLELDMKVNEEILDKIDEICEDG